MWSHMRKRPGMKELDSQFYAAQMFLAIEYLQERDIMHRCVRLSPQVDLIVLPSCYRFLQPET